MKIQFIGAAKTVTGSMHLVEANGCKFLLDCGLYQGKRKIAFEINRRFEFFNPSEIDFVILSHAHIDHAGNLPSLFRRGFKGKVYSTFATRDLCSIMLRDSAHIQQKDLEIVNKKRARQNKNLFEPLYDDKDVTITLKNFVGINYHHEFSPAEGITFSFTDAGHILGSAVTYLRIVEDGRIINLGFTGDLGRPNLPILKDPEKIPQIDFLICESTYGGRFHDDAELSKRNLAMTINEAVKNKSKIIIPAFSVGRTQELVYGIHKVFEEELAPKIDVFVDSPLSVNATNIFRMHPECFDNETAMFMLENEDPFGFNQLKYISAVEESRKLADQPGPCIIISSSGMMEAGRILHHLKNNIEDPNTIILIVGYCAVNTLGRRIVDKEPIIRIFGDEYKVNAKVIELHSFSAHADENETLGYLNQFDKDMIQEIFLVHGDPEAQEAMKKRMESENFEKITIPEYGQIIEI